MRICPLEGHQGGVVSPGPVMALGLEVRLERCQRIGGERGQA
jgi:hypothetical protein